MDKPLLSVMHGRSQPNLVLIALSDGQAELAWVAGYIPR